MPSGGTVDSLSIQINASATKATKALDKLASSLEKIGALSAESGLPAFIEQLDKATGSASGLAKQLDKLKGFSGNIKLTASSTNHLTGAFGSLWKMLKKVAVVSGTIDLFKKGYGLSTDFFETANYFNVVMGEYSEEAYKYAQTVSNALGLDPAEWMSNQATFMSLATTFGNTADSAYLMSKNLTQLVYDMHSLKNVKPEVAMQKIRSAFAGELEPLRDWGVDLSKANLQLVALNNNIDKSFDSMTQAEKAQLRYITIMNQLDYAMGDLSNTLTSPGNQLRLLEMAVQKAARAFGNIFIPILNQVIPVLIAVANAVRNVFEKIAALFGFEYPEITNWDRYSSGISAVGDALDDATGSAKALKKQLAGFDEINNLTTNQGSGSGGVSSGGFGDLDLPTYESLGKSFLGNALDQKIDSILADFPNKIKAFFAKVTDIIKNIDWVSLGKTFGDGLKSIDWKGIFLSLAELLKQALLGLLNFIKGAAGGLLDTGKNIAEGILEGINSIWVSITSWLERNVIYPFVQGIKKLFGIHSPSTVMMEIGQALIEGLKNGLLGIWDAVSSIFSNLWNHITSVASSIGSYVKKVIQSVKDWFVEKWGLVKGSWDNLISGMKGQWDSFKQKIKDGVDVIVGFWDDIKQGAKDMANGVIGAVEGMVNKVISGVNWLIRGLNRIHFSIPDWVPLIGGNSFGFNLGQINSVSLPRLAQGGVVSSPTTALIGENGAEAVVPLENNTEWINKVAAQINSNSDNSQIIVMLDRIIEAINDKDLDVTIGDRDIYNANRRETNRQSRLLGRAY